jgi:hypothetical protein
VTANESERTKESETSIDQLKQSVKSVMAIAKTNDYYMNYLRKELVDSPDSEIASFVELIGKRKEANPLGSVLLGTGEIAFSAFLMFIGLTFALPTFFAYHNPYAMLDYMSNIYRMSISNKFYSTALVLVLFIVSILMIISALIVLRIAGETFREIEKE